MRYIPNNSVIWIMSYLAMAITLLLLLSSILSVYISSQINVVIAKKCTDGSTTDDRPPSWCNSHDSNSFTHSPSGNDGNGEVIPLKHTKKYFNHESHDGDSENDTPFTLPFP